jgi:CRP-like cAMP-binding protein
LCPGRASAGARLIGQGEAGDLFYVLDVGEAETDVDGRIVRRLGPGDSFGEIALLRAVPRTATVTGVTDGTAIVIEREAFVCAVTGDRQSMAAAQSVIGERLQGGSAP